MQENCKQIVVMTRLRKLLSVQTKLARYKAYILPHFTYCSTVWMHYGKTAAAKLEKLNERALRFIFNDRTSTYSDLLESANMPTLQNRRVQDMCILTYKANHGTIPTALTTLLALRSDTLNLRGKLKLVLPRVNTTKYGLNTFKYYGPEIWNFLDNDLRTSLTIKKFVVKIRKMNFDACNCYLCSTN